MAEEVQTPEAPVQTTPPPQGKAEKLYDNLLKDGYSEQNLGKKDVFLKRIQNPIEANKLYSALRTDGYSEQNLGSMDDFRNNLQLPKKVGGAGSPLTSNQSQSGIPTAPDFQKPTNQYIGITDPTLRHKLRENDAHYATIKVAQQMKQANPQPQIKTPDLSKPERSIVEDVAQATYMPTFNEGFNDLVTKPYAGAADFFNRTIDKAYRGITGNDAPEWLVGPKNHDDILHRLVKGYDEAYQKRDKPTNIASEVAESIIGTMPLMASLFTGQGEASLATKLPNLFSKTAKLLGTTGALNAYEDATKAGKGYKESLKEGAKGGVEGVKTGLELDAQMLVGGAFGKAVTGKLADLGFKSKTGEALLHAIATGTVFSGTSAGNDLLQGKDIDTNEAAKQFGMGLTFESIPVIKALHDELSDRAEAKKIDASAAQTGVATTAASNMNAESMMRTLMNTPTERLQAINDNVTQPHEDLYAQSLDNGMKAYEATDPNEKRTFYGNQLLLKAQGDVKNISSKLSDPEIKGQLIDDITNSDELTDDHKAELLQKIDVLTPKADEQVEPPVQDVPVTEPKPERKVEEKPAEKTDEESKTPKFIEKPASEVTSPELKGKEYKSEMMSPNDYIRESDIVAEGKPIDPKMVDEVKTALTKGEPIEPATLTYDKEGKLTAQDGRHRAQAAIESGIKEIPVVKIKGELSDQKSINYFKLGEQDEFYHASPIKRVGELREGEAPQFGKGIYFSTNKDLVINEFGKELTKVNLSIEKPLYTGTKEEDEVGKLAAKNWNKDNLTYDKKDEVWRDKNGKETMPVDETDLGEKLPVKYFSDAAKELGYDAIIDRNSHTYDNEIVVLDKSKIHYKDELPEAKVPEPPKTREEAGVKPEEPVAEKVVEPEKEPATKPIKQEAEAPVAEKPIEGEKEEPKVKIKVKDANLLQPSKLKGSKYNLVLAELPDGKFGIVDTNSGYTISNAYDDEVTARLAYSKNMEKLTPKVIEDAISKMEGKQPQAAGMVMALPFMNEFIEHDVKPVVQKLATNFKESVMSIVRAVSPKTGVSREAKDIVTQNLNARPERQAEVDKAIGAIEKMFDKIPDAQRIDFIDRLKRGKPQATPELQAIADMYGKMDKELYDEVAQFKESLPFKENHFRVLWKELPGSEKSRSWFGMSKRPLEGSKGFLKKATLADISEGIQRGGVPLSTNPMTMFKAAYADAMKFVTAHRMFDALKDNDYVKFVKTGGEVPEGFTKIDDKIAQVYFPVKEGLVKTGEYYIEKNVGRLVNNFLSRDLIRESSIGRGLMNLKNVYTAMELGLSGYHASAIALEGVSSDIGRGFRKMVNLGLKGDFKSAGEGIMDIIKAPFSPKTTFSLGRSTIKLATEGDFEKSDFGKKFLKQNPQAKQYIHDLFMGGGLMKQSADLKANTYKSMKEAAGKDNYIGAALRAIPALNEMVMSPLFDHYIPAMKVGMFMKEFPLALKEQEASLKSGKTTRAEIARKTVDFIDDRLGEMNFDNLFWNRTFKTSMQLMLRSVTWKLGNLRAMGGAPIEQAMEFYNAAKEKRAPNLSPKVAWVLGLATMQTALATVTQYMFTGTYPQTVKDLIAPRLNKDDDKQRMILPTYIKDVTHLAYKGAGDYVKSSLAGDVGKIGDIWSNSDFQKYQIYNPNDDLIEKGKDIGEYVLPKPISISSLQKSIKQGDTYPEMAMSFFGLNKAPKYLTSPPIENKIFDMFNIHEGIKSKGQKEVRDVKEQIQTLYRQKKYDEAEKVASDAMEKGLITQKQFGYLNKHVGNTESPAVYFYNTLPIDDKIALWKEMTPKEREIYDPKGKVQLKIEQEQLYEEAHKKKDKPYSSFSK